jgi:pyruvate dehydrogenase E1 component alpha subunit
MARIRAFEETALEAHKAGEIPGPLHVSIGQEAVPAGICLNLRIDDRLTSNHRGHGHALAKGADPKRMMLELYGREGGYCRGKGGSMHIADFSVGMLGANGVVAGGIRSRWARPRDSRCRSRTRLRPACSATARSIAARFSKG